MFLKVEFAFLDCEKSAVFIFAEYMAMMGLWVFIAFYVSKVLGNLSATKSCPERSICLVWIGPFTLHCRKLSRKVNKFFLRNFQKSFQFAMLGCVLVLQGGGRNCSKHKIA
jgi:hypothetical protein